MRKGNGALMACVMAILMLTVSAGAQDWVNLFDGKTLDGFVQRGGVAKYSVEDGNIVGRTALKTPNSFLCTEKNYENFILELEFKVDERLNSGIQIRSNSLPDYHNGQVHGYQVEIDPDVNRTYKGNFEADGSPTPEDQPRAWTGGIYEEGRRGWLNNLTKNPKARRAFKPGEWNSFHIEAIGPSIKTWINGVPAADLVDKMTPTGFIALQVHGASIADMEIRWRNIRIKDLGETKEVKLSVEFGDAFLKYDFGQSRKQLSNIEAVVRTATPAEQDLLEKEFIKALTSPDATHACKLFACRMLARIGTGLSVPALATMLPDADSSHVARMALEQIPSPRVDEALRAALATTKGAVLVGVINSIGARKDARAVADLVKLVQSDDAAVAEAAISALGKIGSSAAAKAVMAADVKPALQRAKADAMLGCAEALSVKNKKMAKAIYTQMSADANPVNVRIAGLRGLLSLGGSVDLLVAALKSPEAQMRQAAGKFAVLVKGGDAALAKALPGLSVDARIALLNAMASRGNASVLPAIQAELKSDDISVRMAALQTIGVIGNGSVVTSLAGVAAHAEDAAERKAAQTALDSLKAKDVDPAILLALKSSGDEAERTVLVASVLARRSKGGKAALLGVATNDGDEGVRIEALNAVASMVTVADATVLADLLATADSSKVLKAAEKALSAAVAGSGDKGAEPVIAKLGAAKAETRSALMQALASAGGTKAQVAVRDVLKGTDLSARKDAIRALSVWKTAEPMQDLLAVSMDNTDATCQVLALRGFLSMVALSSNRTPDDTLSLYQKGYSVATRPEEKRTILTALSTLKTEKALTFIDDIEKDNSSLKAEAEAARKKLQELLKK